MLKLKKTKKVFFYENIFDKKIRINNIYKNTKEENKNKVDINKICLKKKQN